MTKSNRNNSRQVHAYHLAFKSVYEERTMSENKDELRNLALFDIRRKHFCCQIQAESRDVFMKRSIPGLKVLSKYDRLLSRLSVKQIACGFDHGIAVTTAGQVFTWGSNDCGQLGIGKDICRTVSILHNLHLQARALSVAAGFGHSMCLLDDSTVLAWGLNSNGQLGTNDLSSRYFPTVLTTTCVSSVDIIACGPLFSLIGNCDGVIAASGRLFLRDQMVSVMQTSAYSVIIRPRPMEYTHGILKGINIYGTDITLSYNPCITSVYPTTFIGDRQIADIYFTVTIDGVFSNSLHDPSSWKVELRNSEQIVTVSVHPSISFVSLHTCVLTIKLEERIPVGQYSLSVIMLPGNLKIPSKSLEESIIWVYPEDDLQFAKGESNYAQSIYLNLESLEEPALPITTRLPNTTVSLVVLEDLYDSESPRFRVVLSGRLLEGLLYIDMQNELSKQTFSWQHLYHAQIHINKHSAALKATIEIQPYKLHSLKAFIQDGTLMSLSFRIDSVKTLPIIDGRDSILFRLSDEIEVEERSYTVGKGGLCTLLLKISMSCVRNHISLSLDRGTTWLEHEISK